MADLSDPARVRRQEKREKRLAALRRADTGYVMQDERGRRFMYELIFHRLGLMDTYAGNDAGLTRHEGKRSAGVRLAQELQEDHADEYVLMMTERMAQVKANQAAKAADDDGASDA